MRVKPHLFGNARRHLVALAFASLAACVGTPAPPGNDLTVKIAEYVAAYNARDINGMLEMVTDDVRWKIVSADNVATMTAGKAELGKTLHQYFQDTPSTRSELRGMQSNGNFVAAIEEAMWRSGETRRSQCSLAIYQFENGLISNVWYFASQACADAD